MAFQRASLLKGQVAAHVTGVKHLGAEVKPVEDFTELEHAGVYRYRGWKKRTPAGRLDAKLWTIVSPGEQVNHSRGPNRLLMEHLLLITRAS